MRSACVWRMGLVGWAARGVRAWAAARVRRAWGWCLGRCTLRAACLGLVPGPLHLACGVPGAGAWAAAPCVRRAWGWAWAAAPCVRRACGVPGAVGGGCCACALGAVVRAVRALVLRAGGAVVRAPASRRCRRARARARVSGAHAAACVARYGDVGTGVAQLAAAREGWPPGRVLCAATEREVLGLRRRIGEGVGWWAGRGSAHSRTPRGTRAAAMAARCPRAARHRATPWVLCARRWDRQLRRAAAPAGPGGAVCGGARRPGRSPGPQQ